MSAVQQVRSRLKAVPETDVTKLRERLGALQSKELVIAFSGPIGSGLRSVIDIFELNLKEIGYVVVRIKISELIQQYGMEESQTLPSGKDRYIRLQDLGNELRREKESHILAQLAVMQISIDRAKRNPGKALSEMIPGRVVYLIDQLKHPEEVELLRDVYGANFYLLGVLCGYGQRKQNLRAEDISAEDAEMLMERDRKQEEKHGQKLEKTLQYADFFLRNARSNNQQIAVPIVRFLHLMHGKTSITPTRQEQGMYAAYSAALSSACLSRQVGAAIQDCEGKLIATGCNDVPRGGGGLYAEEDQQNDHRCVHLNGGVCFNHREKDRLRSEVQGIARDALETALRENENLRAEADFKKLANELSHVVATNLRNESRIKDLLEFSRSVHAEMDALVSLARTGSASVNGGVLYTTTYPCHNCARHIIAAGVRAVYFIEPYEKSLAVELHGDAIDHSADEEVDTETWRSSEGRRSRKVSFLHFEGVAPRRFLDLFASNEDRKDPATGKAFQFVSRVAGKRVPQFLEGYLDLESRVVSHLKDIGISPTDDPAGNESTAA